jgi:hypothetical protein
MNPHIEVAEELLREERHEMVASASLLHRRLGKLIERGDEGMGFDLPTIVSLLGRMRDSIEMYRRSKAVHRALVESQLDQPAPSGGGA